MKRAVSETQSSEAGNEDYVSWHDIACTGEYNRAGSENNVTINISKVVYGLHHMLASDAAHRFAFAFAMEKDKMSRWNGSQIAMARCGFNCMKGPRKRIRFFNSTAFAKVHQVTDQDLMVTSLGLDGNGEMKYRFDTKKKVADVATGAIEGKGTRVFVVEEEKTKEIHVLKVCWKDSDCTSESELGRKMSAAVEATCGHEARKFVEEHIATILEDIVAEVDGKNENATYDIMRGVVSLAEQQERQVKEKETKKCCCTSVDPMQSLDDNVKNASKPRSQLQPQPVPKPRSIRRLKHCRVVCKEYATPIQELTKLPDVVRALLGVIQSLHYIHKAGWVHYDISAGNIYLYKNRGLLSNFEYAKKMGNVAEHEVKTGTNIFMAYEAIIQQFHRIPDDYEGPPAVFFHNPLHDLESVFWIYVFNFLDVETEDQDAWKAIVGTLFSGLETSTDSRRCFVLNTSVQVRSYKKHLGPQRKKLLQTVFKLRLELVDSYVRAEEMLPDRPVNEKAFTLAQEKFEAIWLKFLEHILENDEPLIRKLGKRRADKEPTN